MSSGLPHWTVTRAPPARKVHGRAATEPPRCWALIPAAVGTQARGLAPPSRLRELPPALKTAAATSFSCDE